MWEIWGEIKEHNNQGEVWNWILANHSVKGSLCDVQCKSLDSHIFWIIPYCMMQHCLLPDETPFYRPGHIWLRLTETPSPCLDGWHVNFIKSQSLLNTFWGHGGIWSFYSTKNTEPILKQARLTKGKFFMLHVSADSWEEVNAGAFPWHRLWGLSGINFLKPMLFCAWCHGESVQADSPGFRGL